MIIELSFSILIKKKTFIFSMKRKAMLHFSSDRSREDNDKSPFFQMTFLFEAEKWRRKEWYVLDKECWCHPCLDESIKQKSTSISDQFRWNIILYLHTKIFTPWPLSRFFLFIYCIILSLMESNNKFKRNHRTSTFSINPFVIEKKRILLSTVFDDISLHHNESKRKSRFKWNS